MYSVAEVSVENKDIVNEIGIKPKKRFYYLDVLRVLAIMAVISVHSTATPVENLDFIGTQHWWIGNCINGCLRWAIPIFFMISGALLLSSVKEEKIGSFYKKTFKRLVIPFLVWSVLYFLFKHYYFMRDAKAPIEMIGLFFQELLFDRIYNHLWFMYIILTMYLLAPFLKKMIQRLTRNELLVWIGIWIGLSFIYPLICSIYNSITGDVLTISFLDIPFFTGFMGYFVLGYYLSKYEIKKIYKYLIYLGGFISTISVPLLTYTLSAGSEKLDETFYGHFAITSLFMGMAMFLYIKNINWDKVFNHRIKTLLSSASQATFGIYFSHMMIQIVIFGPLLSKLYIDGIGTAGVYVVNLLCVYITSYVIVKILGLSSKLELLLIGK